MKQRMQQGGSVVGFLVTCAVLAALLIGGIYFVRHQGWFGTSSASVATSDNENGTDSNSDDNGPTKQSADKADKKDAATKDAPATVPDSADTSTESSDTDTDSSIPTTGQTATELPQTGPVDAILSMIGAGSIAATAAAYVRSRRLI